MNEKKAANVSPTDRPLMQDPSMFMGPAENSDPLHRMLLTRMGKSGLHVDLGSGRGRFLQLSRSSGNDILGVDSDIGSVEDCRRRGIETVHAEVLSFLETSCPPASTISAVHLIEHLPPNVAMRLLCLCAEKLLPGGRLILVTPNFADWSVASNSFWLDPTHVRPYPAPLLEHMLTTAGLIPIESFAVCGVKLGRKTRLLMPLRRIRYGRQFGRPNTVAIGEKPSS